MKLIYDRLAIESRPVQTLRAVFPPSVVHGVEEPQGVSGHMWLRVRMDGKEYDVCPGRVSNRPGVIHFQLLGPVRQVAAWTIPILHAFSAARNVRRDWRNLFSRRKPE